MNKIKLLYDVVMTMRAKEAAQGTVSVKLNTQVDCGGKRVKHESNTEFDMQCCGQGMHHGHRHGHHQMKCCGVKGKLSHLAIALHILNNLQVEEKGEAGYLLTLDLKEIPEEWQKLMQEKKQHLDQPGCVEESCMGHEHFHCIKELHEIENPRLKIDLQLNKQYEVEKVLVDVTGEKKSEGSEACTLAFQAELSLLR